MAPTEASPMTDRRALLTDREREIVSGNADVENDYRYQTISRVRKRFDRLEGDLEALEEHGELADELRDIVCSDTLYYCPRCGERFPRISEAINHALGTIDPEHEDIDTDALVEMVPEWWLNELPDDWSEDVDDE